MKLQIGVVLFGVCLAISSATGQISATNAAAVSVPPVIQFSDTATSDGGVPFPGTVELTFSLYNNSKGGEPLWTETQTVTLDSSGHYSVYLGITKSNGLPASLFTSAQAHWLGVQIAGGTEQPRVALVSVPYAIKAGDAATVGGLAPSAFVLANSQSSGPSPNQKPKSPATETQNYIPLFIDNSGDLGNSLLYESGSTAVGIATTTPSATLEVNGTAKFDNLVGFASGQTFPGTLTGVTAGTGITVTGSKTDPTISINTTFANEYYPQLNAANTFTKSQTVNGTMTATAFSGSGSALTNVNASLLSGLSASAFAQLGAASNTFSGGITASSLDGNGAGVTNVNAALLAGLSASAFAELAAANTFSGNQTVNGNLSATGLVTGSGFQIGSNLFDYGSFANQNALLGFAGNTTITGLANFAGGFQALFSGTTGNSNTATGVQALYANTTGSANTANGASALSSNTTGGNNTAVGFLTLAINTGSSNTAVGTQALYNNFTGTFNTATGYLAGQTLDYSQIVAIDDTFLGSGAAASSGGYNNATAVGSNAVVGESNALVLGAVTGVNGGTSVNVGIGTTTPAYVLDVHGTGNFTGLVNFASGQTFPGTGTITGVSPGTGLSGGGTSGSVTLNNTGLLGLTQGTGISLGTGQTPTVAINTSTVPLLTSANTFTGNQTINGNLTATGVVNGIGFGIGSELFDYGSYANQNAFLGFAGNGTTLSGSSNTASGFGALGFDNSGNGDTATGSNALDFNSTGSYNTASGFEALNYVTTGSYNTAIGDVAGQILDKSFMTGSNNTLVGAGSAVSTGTLSNATAIGSNAEAGESNTLILGAITGVNSGTSVNVGIGTTKPNHLLEVDAAATDAQIAMVSTGTDAAISVNNTATGGREYWIDSGSGSAGVGAGNFAIWDNSGGGLRLVVTSSGEVGIGTKSPDSLLSVNGSADKPGGGSWGTFSDRRLKTLNGSFSAGLSQILQIHPVRYRYKADNAIGIRDQEEHVGLVAQDVQKVIPEAVTENSKGYLMVNNDPIIWTMLNAIKEQQALIRKQEHQIARLSSQVRAIQASFGTNGHVGSKLRIVKADRPVQKLVVETSRQH